MLALARRFHFTSAPSSDAASCIAIFRLGQPDSVIRKCTGACADAARSERHGLNETVSERRHSLSQSQSEMPNIKRKVDIELEGHVDYTSIKHGHVFRS